MTTATCHNWADIPATAVSQQIKRRLISGEKLMMVQVTFEKGAISAVHRHPHEQMTALVSGALEFEIEGQKRVVRAGEVVYLPSNVPHGVVALEETVILDVFSPPREDFLSGDSPDGIK